MFHKADTLGGLSESKRSANRLRRSTFFPAVTVNVAKNTQWWPPPPHGSNPAPLFPPPPLQPLVRALFAAVAMVLNPFHPRGFLPNVCHGNASPSQRTCRVGPRFKRKSLIRHTISQTGPLSCLKNWVQRPRCVPAASILLSLVLL